MSNETKIEQEKECFCKSKGFRKFLVVALGTFVGVYCALSLFCALHKPPMMFHHPMGGFQNQMGAPAPMGHHGNFKGPENFKGDFKGDFKGVPQRPQQLPADAKPPLPKENPQK